MDYKKSLFTHIISVDEKVDGICHSISGELFFCDKETSSIFSIEGGSKELMLSKLKDNQLNIEWLIEKNFIVPISLDEAEKLYKLPYLEINISILYIVLSLQCIPMLNENAT